MFMIMHVLICAPHGFDPFCMASVHGLLEWSWLMVKWFMMVLGVAGRGSKWWNCGRTNGLMSHTAQCVFLKPYEWASVSMLAGITRILESQSERPEKSHEEDVAERFCKQGTKEFSGTTDPLVAEEWNLSITVRSSRTRFENFDG
ncbi:hypothetical protein F511_36219 [Dorcoceras hygrometricum]|uniref:Uncharacterized protein n=1 Tax=Dorcoceras hygrometricum TaxID=472368 RepID=A0A2Z7BW08_9LAMI|nr:hypothetical protein F511_36219 [Dorcoceras hygrometricum]